MSDLKNIKSLTDFINEKTAEQKYSYGCVMLSTPIDNFKNLQEPISEEHIYNTEENTHGLEIDPHVTVLYGLHKEVSLEDIKAAMAGINTVALKISSLGIFENEEFDVLKLDIESDDLSKLNKSLAKLPHTNKYPEYHPHLTLGYLKPGTGKQYVKDLDKPISFKGSDFIYSKPNGDKIKFKL